MSLLAAAARLHRAGASPVATVLVLDANIHHYLESLLDGELGIAERRAQPKFFRTELGQRLFSMLRFGTADQFYSTATEIAHRFHDRMDLRNRATLLVILRRGSGSASQIAVITLDPEGAVAATDLLAEGKLQLRSPGYGSIRDAVVLPDPSASGELVLTSQGRTPRYFLDALDLTSRGRTLRHFFLDAQDPDPRRSAPLVTTATVLKERLANAVTDAMDRLGVLVLHERQAILKTVLDRPEAVSPSLASSLNYYVQVAWQNEYTQKRYQRQRRLTVIVITLLSLGAVIATLVDIKSPSAASTVPTQVVVFVTMFGLALIPFRRVFSLHRDAIDQEQRLDTANASLISALAPVAQDHVSTILQRRNKELREYEMLFDTTDAPRLVELRTPPVDIGRAFTDLSSFIEAHDTSALGLAGPRGIGKSTVLYRLCEKLTEFGTSISAPTQYNPSDFVRHVHAELARRILQAEGQHQGLKGVMVAGLGFRGRPV